MMLQVFLYPTKLLISERRVFKTMKLVTTANFSNGKVMELEIKNFATKIRKRIAENEEKMYHPLITPLG